MVSARNDAETLEAFAIYARSVREVEERGDTDDPDCPVCAVWNAARGAIDSAPPPTTVAGAIAMLRFGLAVDCTHQGEQTVLLEGSAADRAAYARERWSDIGVETRPYWGALVAIETVEARHAA